jgi:hypothetical protein
MSPSARLVWIELRGWLRKGWENNGEMFRSCRAAAEAIGISKNTVHKAYLELEHFGFLVRTRQGFLGGEGFGSAARFRFTDLAHSTHPPTRDFEKWDGELFVYAPRRPGRKKQNPVPKTGTPCPKNRDRVEALGSASVRPKNRDRFDVSKRPKNRDRSSLPLPGHGETRIRGSSTARAPAQAGGAGSSPAPVAHTTETYAAEPLATASPPPSIPHADYDSDHERHSPDGLMARVADVIETQLRNLDDARAEQGVHGRTGTDHLFRGYQARKLPHRRLPAATPSSATPRTTPTITMRRTSQ